MTIEYYHITLITLILLIIFLSFSVESLGTSFLTTSLKLQSSMEHTPLTLRFVLFEMFVKTFKTYSNTLWKF